MNANNPQGVNLLVGKKVVLAYSGGLDTSVCLKWLGQRGATPYALYLELGQDEHSEDVRNKALEIGAADAFVRDAKAEFAKAYVAPAIKANALYGGKQDRKGTRLNSSHANISYAVFCLKQKERLR